MRLWISTRVPFTPIRVGMLTRSRPRPPAPRGGSTSYSSSHSSRVDAWLPLVLGVLLAGLLLTSGYWIGAMIVACAGGFITLLVLGSR